MDPSRFDHIEQLYLSALSREPQDRTGFLDEACGTDKELRRQLESLLAEDASSENLLESPASNLLAELTTTHLAAGTSLGPYRIEGLLGVGGMGEVYLAHDPRLDRRVAIKLLPMRFLADPVAHERLRREARAAAALDHPFICKVFEVGEDGDALFCVMEYVRGDTLFERLRAGRMGLPEALRIAGEIAEAVEEAHDNRFVHRDLKPSNIMLTPQGHVKVMDFGLAKRVDFGEGSSEEKQPTTGNALSGTPQYMSPEQATGGRVDHRSDLFSFGIILSELVNAKHPFQRTSSLETMAAILRDPPDLAAAEGSGVPAGLVVLIRRLLAKSPDERYGSMREVRADMVRLADAPEAEDTDKSTARRIPVIGRDEERAALLRMLGAAMTGHGALTLVSGEPGIGKTHLARAILAEAARRGCFAVTGHCYEMEGAPPFVPFVEMLEYGARTLPRASFRDGLGEAAPEVAKLMPELRRLFPDIPPGIELPPEQQRRFMFNAYREFVERGARLTPLVAVFEDLHWADESTLQLLQHLVQTVTSMPVLLIGTYRDAELDTNRPFARTLETWLRQKQATHIPLRRLPLAGTGDLLETLSGQVPPPSATRLVFDHTEGNPYFVEEMVRHLTDEGKLFDQHGAWLQGMRAADLTAPQSVRLLIGQRLAKMPESVRRILRTASVIGRSFDLRLLEDVESGSAEAILDTIETAERAQFIEIESAGRESRYRFVHELIRQTLASTLSLPRRQRLHARVAEALERIHSVNPEARTSALAHHLYQAGAAVDADKTVACLTRAADQASASGAFDEALAHIDNALGMLPAEQSSRVAALHAQRATTLRSLGRMAEAVAAFEQALSVFETCGDAEGFAHASIPLAMIHAWTVKLDEALAVSARGLALLANSNSPARVILQHVLAFCAVLSNDIETGIAVFEQVRNVQLPPHPPLLRSVSQLQTSLLVFLADPEAAQVVAEDTDRLCESTGDVWGRVEVAWLRADLASTLGRPKEALSIALQSIPIAERIGHWGSACFCTQFVYEDRVLTGHLEAAAELAVVLEEYDRLHYVPWGVVAKVTLANIARMRGRVDEAVEWCQRAMLPERNHWAGYPHASLALTFAQTGDARMSAALDDALRFVPQGGRPAAYGRWPTLSLVIEALAFVGRVEEAKALLPAAEDMIGRGYALMKVAALPRTTAGIAAACARNWSRAEAHHQTAIDQADTWQHRVCQPIARYWYADMLLARSVADDRTRARGLLSDALSRFESLGMPLYARQSREKLAAVRA